jgi:hypothetical protein
MKGRNLSLLCLFVCLASFILMAIMLFMASNRHAGSTTDWSNLMECVTPTLITGLALIIYFIHKARVA